MQTDTPLFITGLAIGFGIAVIGGLIDFLLSKRNNHPLQTRQLPGCMLYVTGALGFVGIIAMIVSFILQGGIVPAIILGAGVLSGFYAGFAILIIIYLLVKHYWPDVDN